MFSFPSEHFKNLDLVRNGCQGLLVQLRHLDALQREDVVVRA